MNRVRRRRIENRSGLRPVAGQNRQCQAGQEEYPRQNPGGPGEHVGRAPDTDQTAATAAAHAKPAAFATLQQDDSDQRENDQQVDDKQDGFHRFSRIGDLQATPHRRAVADYLAINGRTG
jgi:hypothetical protein